ncbi:hypothetical protein E3T35_13410 [Cryobacterium sp. TMT1-2-2]|uniref:hypothetical protein n=1 Tax=Cryobacterium sp. TMT1-2-2 TaxID=1259233 RepID=UPI00106BDAE2|nr:hypothetical protein [Cryobacterium sp. TMT1-2-2]TFD09995.1 hypothetical protein E3T35_13410 [Cryobacterium sp. TMT1-2-2]
MSGPDRPPTMIRQPDAHAHPASQGSRYAQSLRAVTPVMRRTGLVIVLALGATLGTPAFAMESLEGSATTMTVTEQFPSQARVGLRMGFTITLDAVEPTGTIEVYTGATLLATTDARDRAWISVPTETLLAGCVPLRFVYVSTGDFEGAEAAISVELHMAFARVTITAGHP